MVSWNAWSLEVVGGLIVFKTILFQFFCFVLFFAEGNFRSQNTGKALGGDVSVLALYKSEFGVWRHTSAIKGTYCYYRALEFGFQHPHGAS